MIELPLALLLIAPAVCKLNDPAFTVPGVKVVVPLTTLTVPLDVRLTVPAAVILPLSTMPVGAVMEILPVPEVIVEPLVVMLPEVVMLTLPLEIALTKLNDDALLLKLREVPEVVARLLVKVTFPVTLLPG